MTKLCFSGRSRGTVWALVLAVYLVPASVWAQEGGGDPNPLQVSVSHSGPGEYTPGQPVEIVVTIMTVNDGSLTALGQIDSGPQNWTYAGARPISGALPAVTPNPGAAGRFEFAWISMPDSFPYSFAYTLNVPAEATGDATIQGQAEYRTDSGRQVAPPDFITIKGPDNAAPKLRLLGGATITITQGDAFQDPGTIATDAEDGDISKNVQVAGNVDSQTPGQYLLTYTVADSQGKQAAAVTRTVVVVAKENTPTNNGNGSNSGNNNGGVRPRGGFGAGLAGGNTVGPRQRVEELANTGETGVGDTANSVGNNPAESLADQKKRATELVQQLAAKGSPNAGLENGIVPSGIPPQPGPITTNLAKNLPRPSAAARAAAAPQDDLAALDSALDTGGDPAAPGPRITTASTMANTGEASTAAPSGGVPPMASVAEQAVLATPEVPGLIERVKLRIGGLGPRELTTIAGFGVALVALLGFAAVAGRIAYGGQSRRAPTGPKAA